MQLSQEQQLELHELWGGINRARCELVTAREKLIEIESGMLQSLAALKIAVSYADAALVDVNFKINQNLPEQEKPGHLI